VRHADTLLGCKVQSYRRLQGSAHRASSLMADRCVRADTHVPAHVIWFGENSHCLTEGAHAPRQVRSMQMFRRPVQRCAAGDRVGVCVTQLDPALVERGVACAPGSVPTFAGAIAAVEKIRFFQGARSGCRSFTSGMLPA